MDNAIIVLAVAKRIHSYAWRKKIKHESTTLAIRNAGKGADMKVITLNELIGMRIVKCLESRTEFYGKHKNYLYLPKKKHTK